MGFSITEGIAKFIGRGENSSMSSDIYFYGIYSGKGYGYRKMVWVFMVVWI